MSARTEPKIIQYFLIFIALAFFGLFIVLPLVCVFHNALAKGWGIYFKTLQDRDAIAAMKMTVVTALIAVPLNLIFGVVASWAIAKFDFKGKNFLLTLIDLPLSVSPVIAGLIFILLFGAQGLLGPWLIAHNIRIIFAMPAVILVTIFVTFPIVARELIPIMKSQGNEEEEAAMTLGASGWKTFWLVSVPNIRWGILYGIILCNARAMGEFGAVSVVSGHIRGLTNTLPLHVEILYNEYQSTAAFAAASILALLAIFTLIAKSIVEVAVRRGI
ncbi:MAG: sulfate ABC transporter permease subunit CysW [Candidatus Omnitrophica bacterium]|nr:sulfate ABC transporter permease subunit CysW [Candidatus Omnitrophota bacterium]